LKDVSNWTPGTTSKLDKNVRGCGLSVRVCNFWEAGPRAKGRLQPAHLVEALGQALLLKNRNIEILISTWNRMIFRFSKNVQFFSAVCQNKLLILLDRTDPILVPLPISPSLHRSQCGRAATKSSSCSK
jgi:hypothetical protein